MGMQSEVCAAVVWHFHFAFPERVIQTPGPSHIFFLFLMVFTQNQLVPRENFGLDKMILYPGK